MGSTSAVNGKGILDSMINREAIREKTLKPIEKNIESSKDRLEIVNKKASDLKELDCLINNLQQALDDMTNPIVNPFMSTATKVSTTDIGKGEDFISVKTSYTNGHTAPKRDYEIEVTQLAKASNLVIGAGAGTFSESNPNLQGNLQLQIDGVDIPLVNFDADDDNVAKVLSKINNSLRQEGDEFEAFAISSGSDSFKVEIKAREGITKNITFGNYVNNNNPGSPNVAQNSASAFQQAIITIDGVEVTSNSNKFENVLDKRVLDDGTVIGTTINALKLNQGGNKQILRTGVEDSTNFDNMFRTKFAPAANLLMAFLNKQNSDNFDPEKPNDGPPLSDEAILLGKANEIIAQLVGFEGGVLSEMGIGLQTTTDSNYPPGTRLLDIVDLDKYNESLKDLESIKNKFITNTKISRPANAGDTDLSPSLIEAESGRAFPTYLSGKDFKLNITLDGDGAVTNIQAVLPDGNVAGVYDADKKIISFDANSPIDMLTLQFDPGTKVSDTVEFTVNHTEGHLNRVYNTSQALSDVSGNGLIKLATDKNTSIVDERKAALEKLEKDYETAKTKLDSQFDQLAHIDMLGTIMMDAMAEMINPAA